MLYQVTIQKALNTTLKEVGSHCVTEFIDLCTGHAIRK